MLENSRKLYEKAVKLIPGGVSSPVRSFKAIDSKPIFFSHAKGSYIYDEDNNRYIDYIGSWGPLILGHAHDTVLKAIYEASQSGTSFGTATKREVFLAERIVNSVLSVELVRFVNSGTEATMSALRLARGFTKRDKVITFSGCYHGHADAFLVEAGSGIATLGIPGSLGVPKGATQDTYSLPYNDVDSLNEVFETSGREIAAVILEPIACNMGLVKPVKGFLESIRKLCDTYGALLIFDEVITGFRLGLGGAQEKFSIKPDLTTFGKVIGGGLPVGAYGGKESIMKCVAPFGEVYQAGTLSGNPLAMASGIATLDILSEKGFFENLDHKGEILEKKVNVLLKKYDFPARFIREGSIFYFWFKEKSSFDPKSYDDIKSADKELFVKFFKILIRKGIHIAPSAFEVGFISQAHTLENIEYTLNCIEQTFEEIV